MLRGIDGLTEPYYKDRIIYLNFATEEAWEYYSTPSKRSEITGLIRSRLAQSGRDTSGVEIMNYTYEAVHGIEDDEYMLSMWRRMLILSLGLSLFSGLIIQSAYRNHIAAFSPELMELAALGATKGQHLHVLRLYAGNMERLPLTKVHGEQVTAVYQTVPIHRNHQRQQEGAHQHPEKGKMPHWPPLEGAPQIERKHENSLLG
mgnify:CR=1 FL=1